MRKKPLVLVLIALIATGLGWFFVFDELTVKAGTDYYVDMHNPNCSNAGPGSLSVPFCTISQSQAVAVAGDTFYIAAGRYGTPFNFTKTGTASAPISYIAQEPGVVLGVFEDINDNSLTATPGRTNVFQGALPVSDPDYVMYQTFYPSFVVDDPANDSLFEVSDTDGPLALFQADTLDEVEQYEGTWWNDGSTFYLHPYGNLTPSSLGTDFVLAYDRWWHGIGSNIQYLIFDGLELHYRGESTLVVNGSHNEFRNISVTNGWDVRGQNNYLENVTATHGLNRGDVTDEFHYSGSGVGLVIRGTGNTAKDIHVFHNWNNFILQGSGHTILNGEIHGSPNHCFQANGFDSAVIQNLKIYNCQDGVGYIAGNVHNSVFENITTMGTLLFQDMIVDDHQPNSNLVFRNTIFDGCKIIVGGYGVGECGYESTVTVENSIFFCDGASDFRISHCVTPENIVEYSSIAQYQANCGDNCMTLRNIQLITSNHSSVVVDGLWPLKTDAWNIHITDTNSPAFDTGTGFATNVIDYEGDSRPQGAGYDVGADELPDGGQNNPPILATIGDRSTNENQLLSFTISASDPDGPVNFPQPVNLPTGANFVDNGNSSASFSWTPSFIQAGSHSVTFVAEDGGGLTDSETINITVTNVNRLPTVTDIIDKNIFEGDTLSFLITVTDADADDTLTITCQSLPSGASCTDNGNRTATFNWIPTSSQSGSYPITVLGQDNHTGQDSEPFTIIVQDGSSGCIPAWECTAWSECVDGSQTRSCTDVNECGTDTGRPDETHACDSVDPNQITDLAVS